MLRKISRVVLPALAVALVGGTAYGFMASNTVSASYAGQGAAAISGYTVQHVRYDLSPGGRHIQEVFLELNSATKSKMPQVDLWFSNASSNYGTDGSVYQCTVADPSVEWDAACIPSSGAAAVSSAYYLNVSAAQAGLVFPQTLSPAAVLPVTPDESHLK